MTTPAAAVAVPTQALHVAAPGTTSAAAASSLGAQLYTMYLQLDLESFLLVWYVKDLDYAFSAAGAAAAASGGGGGAAGAVGEGGFCGVGGGGGAEEPGTGGLHLGTGAAAIDDRQVL